jgi:hypothetical protein
MGMINVESYFIVNPCKDKPGSRHTHCQANDIDNRIKAIAEKGVKGDFKIVHHFDNYEL